MCSFQTEVLPSSRKTTWRFYYPAMILSFQTWLISKHYTPQNSHHTLPCLFNRVHEITSSHQQCKTSIQKLHFREGTLLCLCLQKIKQNAVSCFHKMFLEEILVMILTVSSRFWILQALHSLFRNIWQVQFGTPIF